MQLLSGTTLGRCGCHCQHHDRSFWIPPWGELLCPGVAMQQPGRTVHPGPYTQTWTSVSFSFKHELPLEIHTSSSSPFVEEEDPSYFLRTRLLQLIFSFTDCVFGFLYCRLCPFFFHESLFVLYSAYHIICLYFHPLQHWSSLWSISLLTSSSTLGKNDLLFCP